MHTRIERFAAALVGLVLGQMVGNNSQTIAKVFLLLSDDLQYTQKEVAEVSLHVIFVIACAGACFGALAAKRGWASFEQVVTSVSVAAVVAFFAIVDHSLPVGRGDARLEFGETMYYLGWLVALWFVPFAFLPNPGGTFHEWIRRGGGVLAVSATMAAACFLVGAVLETAVREVVDARGWLTNGESYMNDPLRFWMARPATVNAVCGAYIVVAFCGIWWRGLWRSGLAAWMWMAGVTAFVTVYTGVYGWILYAPDKGAAPGYFFLAFSALPIVVALTVLLAHCFARGGNAQAARAHVGWSVSPSFWWLIPVGFAVGFGLNAMLGFAPLARTDGATPRQLLVLTIAHSINGIVLGVNLRLMVCAFRLIPDAGDVRSE